MRIQVTVGILNITFPEIKVNQLEISAIAVIKVQAGHID